MRTRIQAFLATTLITGLCLMPAALSAGQAFTNLHSLLFTNGVGPISTLTLSGNTLYGTARTYGGGTGGGSGSAFRMNVDGSGFTNLHTFSGNADGGNLSGGLLLSGSALYGTAAFGGSNNGVIFKLNTNGTGLTNLYNFSALDFNPSPATNKDGAYPESSLILLGSTLYGTASAGGSTGWGVAFSVSTNGTGYTNLHNFTLSDGQYPGSLISAGNALYGTAFGGGASGYGSIFKMNTNGSSFTNLYSFSNPNGAFPLGSLLLSGSTLYGTTRDGGNSGNGTVFRIETNGTGFTTLYSFTATNGFGGTNGGGARPQAALILWNNALYGTASSGGSSGNGTVFTLNTNGSGFTTLYSFTAMNSATNLDGATPIGGLVLSGSTLYGTASAGGTGSYGTIFSLLAPPPLSIARTGTNVVLTWPPEVTGFNLQSTTNLSNQWTNVSGQNAVTNPISGAQKFYRLNRP